LIRPALSGHAVDAGRADLLLAVAAQFAAAEIVSQDKDDVGPDRRIGCPRRAAGEDGQYRW
jgi:hypothetical protein